MLYYCVAARQHLNSDIAGRLGVRPVAGGAVLEDSDGLIGSYRTGATGEWPGFVDLRASGAAPVVRALRIEHHSVDGVFFGSGSATDAPQGGVETTDFIIRRGLQSTGFQHDLLWLAPDGTRIVTERRTVRAEPGRAQGWVLDLALDFRAEKRVELGRSAGFLCVQPVHRLLPEGGGQLRTEQGAYGQAEAHARCAGWLACVGVVDGETAGMVVLDHPDNAWYPTPWSVTENDCISACPFLWRTATIEPGRPLRLRYRLLIHRGYVDIGWADHRLRDFAEC